MGKPALAAGSGTAAAAPDAPADAHERVVELVTESAEHYEAGRFQRAVDLLERAFALEAAPTIQYNLARAYEGLGNTQRAIDAYRLYLRLDPDAPDRRAVERRLDVLTQQLEEREALRKRAAKAESARPAPQPPPDAGPGWIPWGVSAVGVIIVGVGVAFGLRANAAHGEAEGADYAADAEDANRSAGTYATLANIAFIAGGALTLGGVSWGLFTLPSNGPRQAAAQPVRGPGQLGGGGVGFWTCF